MSAETVAIEVVEIDTLEVVQRMPVRGKSERQIELIMRGLVRQMNTDKFFAREVSE